jgi:hypothetical protein
VSPVLILLELTTFRNIDTQFVQGATLRCKIVTNLPKLSKYYMPSIVYCFTGGFQEPGLTELDPEKDEDVFGETGFSYSSGIQTDSEFGQRFCSSFKEDRDVPRQIRLDCEDSVSTIRNSKFKPDSRNVMRNIQLWVNIFHEFSRVNL